MNYSHHFLSSIPKSDLHCHLDGSLRLGTLIELAKESNLELPSYTEEGLLELVFKENYRDLSDYLRGFAYTCAALNGVESIERVAYELGLDCLAEGVYYLEVRFAPQLLVREGMSIATVLAAVDKGLGRARKEQIAGRVDESEPSFQYGIIVCAMRMFTKAFGPYFDSLLGVMPQSPAKEVYQTASLSLAHAVVKARDDLGLPIVGFDLAGAEAGFPASDHVRTYHFLHQNFVKKTVHAGEAYGPQSIFQAITKLHADRIGHGTHLFSADMVGPEEGEGYVERLSEYIADRRITFEVCLTSNMQTMPQLSSLSEHPFRKMIERRLSVALCTDNRLVSRTTVTGELQKAVDAFDLSPTDLRNITLHGFKRSFYPGSYLEKRTYVRKVIDFYDKISAEHGFGASQRGDGAS